MRAAALIITLIVVALAIGGIFSYAERTKNVVLFSHGTPEVPQGRMFTIFNPFRDRAPEHTAESLINDLRTDKCEAIVRALNLQDNYDSRICSVMSKSSGYSLLWRQDRDSAKVLVYAVPEKQARLWIGFRRDEIGFVVSAVSVVR